MDNISNCFKKTLFNFEDYIIDPYGRGFLKSHYLMRRVNINRVAFHIVYITPAALSGLACAIEQGASLSLIEQSVRYFF